MALVLSLSLDLFLMKGNFIAVRAQPRDSQGREGQNEPKGGGGKGKNTKGQKQKDVVNVFTNSRDSRDPGHCTHT